MKINWKYAIGEVLIVIIGISIAFWLNNWNQQRSDQNLKEQYVSNLIEDVNAEIKKINEYEAQVRRKLDVIQSLTPELMNPNLRNDSTSFKVFELANIQNFNPENSTYQTLINSGDMKLLGDFELRRSIETHYSQHAAVKKDYERIEKIHEKYLGEFFIYKIDFAALYQGKAEFLNDPLLFNIIISMQGAYRLISASHKACLASNKNLLTQLEQLAH